MYTIVIKNWLENNGNFTFSRSSGPGGQNVNKVNTKVTLHLNIDDLNFLSDKERELISTKLSNRINGNNQLVITCEEERTQSKNRAKLIYKTVILLEKAMVRKKRRKPTKPSMSSKKRRLESKRKQGLKKTLRQLNGVDL
ncbi:MAG: hypothetical protein B6229_08945 [Spirochaetaceae bacterium 4572_7]|nr:MAG: hypothetical protein B6229_08945 [Spirochaetaceae bacterium 4572_7]